MAAPSIEPTTAPAMVAGADGRDVPTPKLVGVVWFLLLVNCLGYTKVDLIIPFPKAIGQLVTMGSLIVALVLALALNPRVRVRPSAYLTLLTVLFVVALASSLRLQSGMGALLRCFRLAEFVTVLWLLSVWWKGDLRFVRFHLRALVAVLSTVLLGLMISPGAAFSGPEGRLVGAIWPIPAPQVGLYCATAIGLSVLMWMTRNLDGRSTLLICAPAAGLLLLSHTRTALSGLIVALIIAGISLTVTNRRARQVFGLAIGLGGAAIVVFGDAIQTWLLRGQDADQLASLTGRAKVWDALLAKDRSTDQELIGVGLTNKSFGGLPVDSNWLSVYDELGWAGIAIVVAIIGTLLVTAALRPPSPQRACSVFLVVYCIVASYTEVGLGDASPYLLNLAVAAGLLVYRSPDTGHSTPSWRKPA